MDAGAGVGQEEGAESDSKPKRSVRTAVQSGLRPSTGVSCWSS